MRQYLKIGVGPQMRPVMNPGHRRSISTDYFEWLLNMVDIPPMREHEDICWELFHTEFFWSLPNDENRALDICELLEGYREYTYLEAVTPSLVSLNAKILEQQNIVFSHDGAVSVFEMLIALAKRMDFQLSEGGQPSRLHLYFWEMLRNLGYDPALTLSNGQYVIRKEGVIQIWLDRAFSPDGKGSIFPLDKPLQNQREIEIWSQMGDYMHEKYLGRS